MGAVPPVPLLQRVRERIRVRHYSIRTEQAYCDWIRRFVIFHGKRHPSALGAADVEAFLTSLAVEGRVAASTQNQAKSALLFLYKEVLGAELPWLDHIQKAKAPIRLPVVLTRAEVGQVLARLQGVHRLIGALLYGTGLRIMEGMRLRVKDVEFSRREILVRDGKGNKDRVTMLPLRVVGPLREQVEHVRELHRSDLADGFGAVWLPFALDRKYPGAAREWGWQYVFPAGARSIDLRDGVERRHHLADQAFQRAMKNAVRGAGLAKPATPHTLRPFLRDAPAGIRLRHPHSAGAARALGREHDDDLYARAQSRGPRGGQSARWLTLGAISLSASGLDRASFRVRQGRARLATALPRRRALPTSPPARRQWSRAGRCPKTASPSENAGTARRPARRR
jgi:integron integrase